MLEHNFRKEKEKNNELKRQMDEKEGVATIEKFVCNSKFFTLFKILNSLQKNQSVFQKHVRKGAKKILMTR